MGIFCCTRKIVEGIPFIGGYLAPYVNCETTTVAALLVATTALWFAYQAYLKSQSKAQDDSVPAAAAPPTISRRVKSYEETSITDQEVKKLVNSPEFQTYWAKNRAKIIHRVERAERPPYFVTLLCALAALALVTYAPLATTQRVSDGDAALGASNDTAVPVAAAENLPLIARLDIKGVVTQLVEGTPLANLVSLQTFLTAVPLLLLVAYLAGMLEDSPLGDTVSIMAFLVMLAVTNTLAPSWGLAGFVALTVVRFRL